MKNKRQANADRKQFNFWLDGDAMHEFLLRQPFGGGEFLRDFIRGEMQAEEARTKKRA